MREYQCVWMQVEQKLLELEDLVWEEEDPRYHHCGELSHVHQLAVAEILQENSIESC